MSRENLTDSELLTLFRTGKDRDALGTLYLRYMELIYGVCLKYTGSPEAAQDAVMDIYEHVNKKLPNHQVDNVGGWLYMVSKNHCLQLLRKKNAVLTVSLDDPLMQNGQAAHQDDDFTDLDQSPDTLDLLHACISALPDHQAICIRQFYFEKKSYAEISTIYDLSLDQVRSNIQNGRRNLKKCLESKHIGAGKNI